MMKTFQLRLIGGKCQQLMNLSHLNQRQLTSTSSVFSWNSIYTCKRHAYFLSSVNQGYNQRQPYWKHHCAFCRCSLCQNLIKRPQFKTTNYNTLSSRHGNTLEDTSNRNWTCSTKSHSLIPIHRQLNTRDILESFPSKYQPYMRLIRFDKPIGMKFINIIKSVAFFF